MSTCGFAFEPLTTTLRAWHSVWLSTSILWSACPICILIACLHECCGRPCQTKIGVDDIQSFPLIYCASCFIIEGSQVGQT